MSMGHPKHAKSFNIELQPCSSNLSVSYMYKNTTEMIDSLIFQVMDTNLPLVICIVMIQVVCHDVELSTGSSSLLLSGSRLPTVLLQALPKWPGPVGEAY